MEKNRALTTEIGEIYIADEVVSIIAGLAATDIKGVANMGGGLSGGLAEVFGRTNLSKGVKVEVGDQEASVDMYLVVEYGNRIPDMAWSVQNSVKKAIEKMVGMTVLNVNVYVQGISFPEEEEAKPQKKVK